MLACNVSKDLMNSRRTVKNDKEPSVPMLKVYTDVVNSRGEIK
jgi:hypothetical protein